MNMVIYFFKNGYQTQPSENALHAACKKPGSGTYEGSPPGFLDKSGVKVVLAGRVQARNAKCVLGYDAVTHA